MIVRKLKEADGISRKRCVMVSMLGVVLTGAAFYHRISTSYIQHRDPLSIINSTAGIKYHNVYAEETGINTKPKSEATRGVKRLNPAIEDGHEPYLNRWQRRFASSRERNKKGGYLFFKHIRKAGGTSLRDYFRDVLAYHNVTRNVDDWRAMKKGRQTDEYQIHYIEHEFQAIDWQCPSVDPRWRESVRIIVLRHPIERHLSEFFFSGSGKEFSPINKQQLSSNETYAEELASFLSVQVPDWMKGVRIGNTQGEGSEGKFNMIFGRFYTDNFQLRALAGCTSGDCLEEREVTDAHVGKINEFHPSSYSYSDPVPICTNFFRKDDAPVLFEQCAKQGHLKEHCSIGCDGPCFYPSVAWGTMGSKDVARAASVLKEFDAVLLMEKLDDRDQSDFLSDILGVPPDADFSLAKRGSISNYGVEKAGKREKSRFYRELLSKLSLRRLNTMLHRENQFEIELFNHARKLNSMMIDQWKKENNDS